MEKKLMDIKFKLTKEMVKLFIDYTLKRDELLKTQQQYNLNKNKILLGKIKKLEKELDNNRDLFVKNFRLNNVEEIEEYLRLKKEN